MRIAVVIPTYNEKDNLRPLIESLLAVNLPLEICVVDDDSPDGTADVVKEISKTTERVHLLLRKEDRGRGAAGIAGFQSALASGADYIIEMDGDGSHDPKDIPRFVERIRESPVVIGSRYLAGSFDHRSLLRKTVSSLARSYIKFILGITCSDPTSGFRCFSREALEKLKVETLTAKDPFIITEVLYKCHRLKMKIVEVPIVLKERTMGKTKLRVGTLVKYLYRVVRLRLTI